ncbi:MAG: hypothetical protein LBD72_02435 [Puniceicoccales bacterium]|nr:hypothetical protein [Puniceicoccales bacterium]
MFFDYGKSTAHLEIYPEYRTNRALTTEDLRKQMQPIMEIAEAVGIAVITKENVEANNLLAAHAVQRTNGRTSVAVASADMNFVQIIGPIGSVGRNRRLAAGKWRADYGKMSDSAEGNGEFFVPG